MKTHLSIKIGLFLVLGILAGGCGVNVQFSQNSEGMARQLHNYQIAKARFDLNDPLLKQRIIFLSGSINISAAEHICSHLIYLNDQSDSEPITLYINSNGGDGTAYLSIRNIIRSIKAPVNTVNAGLCASAGFLLFMDATGKRYAMPESAFLLHEPRGTPKELEKLYIEYHENVLLNKTKVPRDWLPIKARQFTVTAEEAKKYEIADDIIEMLVFPSNALGQ